MKEKQVPLGFGLALAKNEAAVNAYAMMTREQKKQVLARAKQVQTKEEMQQLMQELAESQSL